MGSLVLRQCLQVHDLGRPSESPKGFVREEKVVSHLRPPACAAISPNLSLYIIQRPKRTQSHVLPNTIHTPSFSTKPAPASLEVFQSLSQTDVASPPAARAAHRAVEDVGAHRRDGELIEGVGTGHRSSDPWSGPCS